MPREDILNRLEEIARRVSKVHPVENAEIVFVNLIAGAIYALHRLANKIKHEPDAQIGRMWHVTLIDAVDTLEVLCTRLEDLLNKE